MSKEKTELSGSHNEKDEVIGKLKQAVLNAKEKMKEVGNTAIRVSQEKKTLGQPSPPIRPVP